LALGFIYIYIYIYIYEVLLEKIDGCLKGAKKGPTKLVKYLKNVIFAIVEGKIFYIYILNCMLKL